VRNNDVHKVAVLELGPNLRCERKVPQATDRITNSKIGSTIAEVVARHARAMR